MSPMGSGIMLVLDFAVCHAVFDFFIQQPRSLVLESAW